MIVESNKTECPIIAVDEKKAKCPFAAANKTDRIQKKNNKETKNSSSSSFVMPPHPPGWRSLPIVGHAPMLLKYAEEGGELAPALLKAFNMCDGDMASLDIPGMGQNGFYVTSNADYAGIVSTDLEHWGKITHKDTRGPFYMARQVIGDALFVASDTEPNWGKAHRILMPAFSPNGLKSLGEITLYKVDRLLERIGSSREPFEIGDTFTSLTFDVIGNYIGGPALDFGTTEHPERMETDRFLVALDVALRSRENAQKIFSGRLDRKMYKKRMDSYKTLHDSAMEVINDRLNGKTKSKDGHPDVLDRMLNTVDKETNEKMDIALIRNHLILFLLVGHDSTSSLLTSLIYLLSQHPEVEEKVREEVETVIGEGVPNMQNIKKLTYTMAVIKETLRLFPPAVALGKTCLKDTTLGPWQIKEGARMIVVIKELHRNKDYWGENADEFDPSRFLPDSPNAQTHDYAWLPFSSGPRGCIGMQFSLIEARIILARMVQRFTFRLHKDADVKDKFRTFVKLSGVYVTAHEVKKNALPSVRSPIIKPKITTAPHPVAEVDVQGIIESHNGKLDIYYGSNTGTCEDLAHRLCNDSKQLGFDTTISPLDVAASKGFETDRLALIVTSTYNGQPPDNAKKFAEYCKEIEPKSLSGVNVAIIGVGNSNWKSFQAFPSFIETALRSAGAQILCKRGVADEEKDIQGDIDSWIDSEFWPLALESIGIDPIIKGVKTDRSCDDPLGLVITDSDELSSHLLRSPENVFATVMSTYELQSPGSGRSTRHVEFKLPTQMQYSAGDHLAVFPENHPELVLRFGSLISEHDLGRVVTVTTTSNNDKALRHLPLGIPTKVSDLLGRHVDLQAPITASFVNAAVLSAVDPEQRDILRGISDLISNGVNGDWQQLRPAQILTAFPSVRMTLKEVLPTIAPMKKRYYSISSSPLGSKTECQVASVTVGVVEGTEASNSVTIAAQMSPQKFRGVSSGFLAGLRPGQLTEVRVVKNERFRLPKNKLAPVIMIGPGTGLAPFRGFLQELQLEAKQRQAMLFFGCRNEKDYIYRSELESAPIDLHVAFSRPANGSKKSQYVQDLLWESRDRVWQLLKEGAYIYVCGDGRYMAKDVDKTLCRIAAESGNLNEEDAIAFFEQLQKNGCYLQDVWCN